MRALVAATVLVALCTATACSSDQADQDTAEPTHGASDAAGVGWSPCDALPAASVSKLVGEAVSQETGTESAPRCTFTPKEKGGAAYDVSYLWFDGGLDNALDAMGATGEQLRKIDVDGADAARLVVSSQKSGVLVTGFVQTEGLVQSVNAVQVKPYDEQQVVAGTKALLAELAAQAPTSSAG